MLTAVNCACSMHRIRLAPAGDQRVFDGGDLACGEGRQLRLDLAHLL
jgi:hypothetical protein